MTILKNTQLSSSPIFTSVKNFVIIAIALVFFSTMSVAYADYIVSGTQTYNSSTMGGTVTLSNGSTLNVSGQVVWSGTTPNIVLSSGKATLRSNGSVKSEVRSTITTNGNLVVESSGGSSFFIPGTITGSGSVTREGGYDLTLTADNSYTGGMTINAGSLYIYGDNSQATGGYALVGNSGTSLSFKNSATIKLPGGNTVTPSATKGAGPLTIGSSSTNYNKTVNIESNASYTITDSSKGISMTNSSGDSALNVAGTVTNAGTLSLARRSTINLNNGGRWTQTGAITVRGNGGYTTAINVNTGSTFTYNGTSAIAVNPSGDNSGSGEIHIYGTFQTTAGFDVNIGVTGSGRSRVKLSQGTIIAGGNIDNLIVTGSSVADTPIFSIETSGTINTNGYNVTLNTNNISDAFTGSGTLTKTGAGILTLSGSNKFTGNVNITGGALKLTKTGATGTLATGTTVTVTGNTSVLQGSGDILGYDSTTVGTINLNNGGKLYNDSSSAHITVGATIKMNNGIIEASGKGSSGYHNFVFDAPIYVTGGTDNVINAEGGIHFRKYGSTPGEGGGLFDVAKDAVLTINSSIYESSYQALTKRGEGTLILTKANSYGNGTKISGGILKLTQDGTLSNGSVTLGSGTTLEFAHHNVQTFGNLISGNGAVTKTGTGELTITNHNTYTGGTTIEAGTLKATGGNSADSVFGTGKVTIRSGATLDASEIWNVFGWNANNDLEIAGTLKPHSLTHVKNVTLTSGTVEEDTGDTGTNPRTGLDFKDRAGTITSSGTSYIKSYMQTNGTLKIDVTADTLTCSNYIIGKGSLTKTGDGELVLTQRNTYTGGTIIEAGTVSAPGGHDANNAKSVFGTGKVTVKSGATLDASGIWNIFGWDANNDVEIAGTFKPHSLTHVKNVTLTSGTIEEDTGTTDGLDRTGLDFSNRTATITSSGASYIKSYMNTKGTLAINVTGTLTDSNAITGSGAITKSGTGKLFFRQT